MASGETITLAWRMAVAPRSASEVGVGTVPPKALRPSRGVTPRPKCWAVAVELRFGRFVAKPMKAALQDRANASSRLNDVAASPSKLRKVWAPTAVGCGQL